MSGICGICEPGRAFVSRFLEPMLSALVLPGESPTETAAGNSAAVGVAPLWAMQEVASIDGVRIAIDADLYNLPELKAVLAKRGYPSSEWPAAICLARLYELEGPGFLQRLHGVFALAIWDEKAQRLLLAIDRLGVKSLHWCKEQNRVLFASRLGAIRAVHTTPLEIQPSAVIQYLLFSVIPHPLTVYEGVEKLAPGTLLLFEKGQIRLERYWDLNYQEDCKYSEVEWAKQVQDGLRSAVQVHIEGCSPARAGAYLSGGTDSSSVVAFMNERLSPVNTFSIFFSEDEYSEANFARTTANKFRTSHHERNLGPQDALEALHKLARFYDEPFANSSAFGAYYCAALARDAGVRTLLAGDGGDELFGGNSRYADDKRFGLYHSIPRWARRGFIEPFARLLPVNDGLLSLPGKYIRRASIPNPRRIFSYGLFLSTNPEEVFEPGFLTQCPPETWMQVADGHFQGARANSELNRLLYLDMKIILADNDLRKVNGTAELSGVQVRYPLLDFKLAELAARIPSRLKLKGFEKRYIFKKAMQQILPDAVLYKKKHGFGVPLGHWLNQDRRLQEFKMDLLMDPRTRQRGYFRPDFYDRLLRLHRETQSSYYGEVVWYLLALEMWHRQHFDHVSGASSGR